MKQGQLSMVDSINPFPTISLLAKECKASWPFFRKAAANTVKTEKTLRKVLAREAGRGRLLDSDCSLVLCGSFARYEMMGGSDCDWTLLINGVVNSQHAMTAQTIQHAIATAEKNKEGLKCPGTSGTFGSLTFSHDLVHRIGGGADSNENLTRRALMILESRPVSLSPADLSQDVWKAVLRSILERYFEEDVHFVPGGTRKVPRFLLNDLTRYWRTIGVDYAAKHKEQEGRRWAIRNAKLRFSRKLLFASGLAFCLNCQLDPPHRTRQDLFGEHVDKSVEPFIDLAMTFASTPPLEYLASFINRFVAGKEKRRRVAKLIFGSYNRWLGILGNESTRIELESLSHEGARTDETFARIRKIGKDFAKGLKLLFFDRYHDTDPIANITLEYIAF